MNAHEIKTLVKDHEVFMRTSPAGFSRYSVIGARVKDGTRQQVKVKCHRARCGYIWWDITVLMVFEVQP